MARITLLYSFLFDGASISCSSEVSTLPDDNVVHDFVAKAWRTTGGTSQWIKFDLGSPGWITQVALFGHNLTSGATVTLQANATDTWGSPAYNQVLTWDERVIIKYLDETYRWWRITFADATNPDGYIEVGRICAGPYFGPTINFRDGWRRSRIDPSEKQRTEGQQVYARLKDKFWRYRLYFKDLPEADQTKIEAMFEAIGNTGYVVVSADPSYHPNDWTIYAQMTTQLGWVMQLLDYGTLDVIFEEQF